MGIQKSKPITTNHSTHRKGAGKGLMNRDKNILTFLTDSSKTQDTVTQRKSWVGQKLQRNE